MKLMNNIKNLCYKYGLKTNQFKIIKLKGDASDRVIYRIIPYNSKVKSFIAIKGSNIEENIAFLEFTNILKENNFNVPNILQVSEDKMYYLLEDLGDITVNDRCKKLDRENKTEEIEELYTRVIEILPQIQIKLSNKIDYEKFCYQYNSFDKENILEDVKLFKDYYLEHHLNKKYNKNIFDNFMTSLIDEILNLTNSIPSFFLYRDFQTRNIMLKDDNTIYFIDYQSGRKGLPYYDLASFLFSSSSQIMNHKTNNLEEILIDVYLDSFKKFISKNKDNFDNIENIIENLAINNKNKFKRYLYAFGIIRIMQAIGRYFYLYKEKDKKEYINKAPKALKTLNYLINNYNGSNKKIW